jgi:glucosylceramidase
MKNKPARVSFLHMPFFVVLIFSSIFFRTAQAQNQIVAGSTVQVWVSSAAGDRLSKKQEEHFTSNTNSLPVDITINPEKKFQAIEGFGATFNEAGMICLNSLSPQASDKVFQSLFDSANGAGFTLMKSPIAACDFASAGPWYSYNETPGDTLMNKFSIQRDLGPNGLISFIRKAARFGKFRIESPMDFAPDWMYVSLKPGEKHIRPEFYSALSRYYAHYLKAYQDNGVQIDFLNLFNEANNEWYSNVTYKEMAQMIKYFVAPRLKSEGLSTKIQFGETANRPEAIQKFPPGLDDDELKNLIHSLTVHGYDWDKFSTLKQLHDKYPGLPIWQTEVCYAMPNNVPPNGPGKLPVYGFEDGAYWGNMIINDMKNWVVAWIYWNMILDEQGGPWLVSPIHGDPDNNRQHPVVIIDRKTKKIIYTGLYYYLAHFSRFVRPGAYRIECAGGDSSLNFAGFQNLDGSIILNIINNGRETDCRIVINKLSLAHRLPSHSITTLKWDNSNPKE